MVQALGHKSILVTWYLKGLTDIRIKTIKKAETFAGRNYRDFGRFPRKFLPGKKLNFANYAKVFLAKTKYFLKITKVYS